MLHEKAPCTIPDASKKPMHVSWIEIVLVEEKTDELNTIDEFVDYINN